VAPPVVGDRGPSGASSVHRLITEGGNHRRPSWTSGRAGHRSSKFPYPGAPGLKKPTQVGFLALVVEAIRRRVAGARGWLCARERGRRDGDAFRTKGQRELAFFALKFSLANALAPSPYAASSSDPAIGRANA